MTDYLDILDQKILCRFDLFADMVQNRFGKNCFYLAKATALFTLFSNLGESFIRKFIIGDTSLEYEVLNSLILTFCICGLISIINKSARRNRAYPDETNPIEKKYAFLRIIFIVAIIFSSPSTILSTIVHVQQLQYASLYAGAIHQLGDLSFFACVYFASSTPCPPEGYLINGE